MYLRLVKKYNILKQWSKLQKFKYLIQLLALRKAITNKAAKLLAIRFSVIQL